jgi:hypothetical protein
MWLKKSYDQGGGLVVYIGCKIPARCPVTAGGVLFVRDARRLRKIAADQAKRHGSERSTEMPVMPEGKPAKERILLVKSSPPSKSVYS